MAEKRVEKKAVEIPVCARCKTNPRWEVTKRATGKKYYWSLCRECETDRQRTNRARRKVRNTSIVDLGVTKKPASILKKNGIETVGNIEKAQVAWEDLDGIGPKIVKQIKNFLVESNLV